MFIIVGYLSSFDQMFVKGYGWLDCLQYFSKVEKRTALTTRMRKLHEIRYMNSYACIGMHVAILLLHTVIFCVVSLSAFLSVFVACAAFCPFCCVIPTNYVHVT